jgi:hypothetical protein
MGQQPSWCSGCEACASRRPAPAPTRESRDNNGPGTGRPVTGNGGVEAIRLGVLDIQSKKKGPGKRPASDGDARPRGARREKISQAGSRRRQPPTNDQYSRSPDGIELSSPSPAEITRPNM